MLKNYFNIAFRNLVKNLTYSIINIGGLAIGLASAIIIGLWVYQEATYDTHFEHSDRIYRVGVSFFNVGDLAPGPEQFTETVMDFPEVEMASSLNAITDVTIRIGQEEFIEPVVFEADSNFFDLFSYSFLKGDARRALDQPQTVVISRKLANKYFGGGDLIGRVIEVVRSQTVLSGGPAGEEEKVNITVPYTVTGIVDTDNLRSHMQGDIWLQFVPDKETNWSSARYYNYVMLSKNISEEQFASRLNRLIKNRVYPSLGIDQPYEEWIKTSSAYRFIPLPLTDIYLRSDLRFDLNTAGNEANVMTFSIVVLFIIVIAGVNFINITTARAGNRAKEVGIRKTLGTERKSLILQFLGESVLTSFCSLLLALGLAELFLVGFEKFTGITLLDSIYLGLPELLTIVVITLVIGIFAGLYPALYLSSFKPVTVLKNKFYGSGNSLFRNTLVATQFTIAVCLLICTGLVYQQLDFMLNKDMGLKTENVLIIENADLLENQKGTFKQQVLEQTGVQNASFSYRVPASSRIMVQSYRTEKMQQGKPFQVFYGDDDYLATLGFRLLKGRDFSEDIAGDTAAVILNESAVRELELEEPIGAILNDTEKVIGVVSDFNFESLREEIEPAAIMYREQSARLAIKITGTEIADLIQRIQSVWGSYNPEEPMQYYFLDQNYAQMVKREQTLAKTIILFSILAVIISCLGLYGLSAYMCEQRRKEIGIRKVMGATITGIVVYLNKTLTKPILLSIALAVPLAFLIITRWLNNFAYKIEIGPEVFIGVSLLALLIAWITVSWQSIRAASVNPVKSLKEE